jgi:hypothetical protein
MSLCKSNVCCQLLPLVPHRVPLICLQPMVLLFEVATDWKYFLLTRPCRELHFKTPFFCERPLQRALKIPSGPRFCVPSLSRSAQNLAHGFPLQLGSRDVRILDRGGQGRGRAGPAQESEGDHGAGEPSKALFGPRFETYAWSSTWLFRAFLASDSGEWPTIFSGPGGNRSPMVG